MPHNNNLTLTQYPVCSTMVFRVDSAGVSAPTFDAATNATVTEAGMNITLTFTETIRCSAG